MVLSAKTAKRNAIPRMCVLGLAILILMLPCVGPKIALVGAALS